MPTLRQSIARAVHDGRVAIGWSKETLALRSGISRSMVGRVERGVANVTVDTADRILDALGQQAELTTTPPFVTRSRQADAGHARCGGHVHRRLASDGWACLREVEVVHGRSHGWIDVLAFNPRDATLLIVEIKTEIRDLGRIERTLTWYAREAPATAKRLGWSPRRTKAWLLVLATTANDDRIRDNQVAITQTLRGRGKEMLETGGPSTGLAMIDPRSRRRDWLLLARSHGRRSVAPYPDYAEFMRGLKGEVRNREGLRQQR